MKKKIIMLFRYGEKVTLSFEEANAYSGIGINKLRELTNSPKMQLCHQNRKQNAD